MKKIAFFDFDGTITTKDTMLELIRFYAGSAGLYSGLARTAPYIIAAKLKLSNFQKAKEKLLGYFFKGMKQQDFEQTCQAFTTARVNQMIRPAMQEKILNFQQSGIETVVVTASASDWVKYWCAANGCRLIATEMEIVNGLVTGKLSGKNCNYEEKARRIQEVFSLAAYDEIYAFGDSKGDEAMLALATHPFFQKF